MTTRRVFIMQTIASASVIAAIQARAQVKLDEKDPQAQALGYVADTNKADKKKYSKHEASQKCGNCQLFQGKASDAVGGCPLFAGKQVSSSGWCSAYAKKAG